MNTKVIYDEYVKTLKKRRIRKSEKANEQATLKNNSKIFLTKGD